MNRYTDRAKKVLELSLREALQLGHNYIGPEHILLAMIREGESLAAQALDGSTRKRVLELMRGALDKPKCRTVEERLERLERELGAYLGR